MEKIEIFVAYAPEDVRYRDMILTCLKSAIGPRIQQGLVSVWHHGLILGGQSSAEEIAKHQRSANLFLFLVSSDFVMSDFYNSLARHDLIRRHNAGEIHVVPVILRPTLWNDIPFSELKSLPENCLPLNSWSDRDEALLNVAQGIRTIVESLLSQSQTEQATFATNQKDTSELLSMSSLCEVVVLTALPVEYDAVLRYLQQPLHEIVHPSGTIYQQGTFVGEQRTWSVAIAEIGMGGAKAAVETEKVIAYLNPQLILFVGIAGGIKDVSLGDVVAATKIYAYESGKARRHFEPRPEVWRVSHALEQRARAEARNNSWITRLSDPKSNLLPQVFIGPLAAGEKVLASTRASTFNLIKSTYGDTLAVEMEGHGFLQAIQANQGVLGLVIRGISDLIDDKSDSTSVARQDTAARHAAAFAFQILAKF